MITQLRGSYGEKVACQHLKKNNYIILERNYRKRFGEIDIIAKKGDLIAFVEVKTRSCEEFGKPSEAVNYAKRQRIIKTALSYIAQKDLDAEFSFDIIEVLINNKKVLSINHIENAFYA